VNRNFSFDAFTILNIWALAFSSPVIWALGRGYIFFTIHIFHKSAIYSSLSTAFTNFGKICYATLKS
jgi:hypothetical protein